MKQKRKDYLHDLAIEYNVPYSDVLTLAGMLGEIEDHDGLLSELEMYSQMLKK